MFLSLSLFASLLILTNATLGRLPLPGASRRPSMPSSSNRAIHSRMVRSSMPAKSVATLVECPLSTPRTAIILSRILMSFSVRMASVSSRILLSVSSIHYAKIWCALSFLLRYSEAEIIFERYSRWPNFSSGC